MARTLGEARSSAEVTELTDDQVERLGRCRVLVDPRHRTDVADSVKTKVWDCRRKHGRSVGPRSSGLLLAHLLAEVHRRAAFAEHAVWTKAEMVHAVVQDERDIVDVLGGRDWGSVLGLMAPVPDLPRTPLVEQIVSALQPYRPTGRSVRHCTLTGLCGIGKSSLAAAYADAYEAIYWIDATSPDSIEDGFQALAVRLGIEWHGHEPNDDAVNATSLPARVSGREVEPAGPVYDGELVLQTAHCQPIAIKGVLATAAHDGIVSSAVISASMSCAS